MTTEKDHEAMTAFARRLFATLIAAGDAPDDQDLRDFYVDCALRAEDAAHAFEYVHDPAHPDTCDFEACVDENHRRMRKCDPHHAATCDEADCIAARAAK
jgi:hypothetical protein